LVAEGRDIDIITAGRTIGRGMESYGGRYFNVIERKERNELYDEKEKKKK
jgi:hypothetical protein